MIRMKTLPCAVLALLAAPALASTGVGEVATPPGITLQPPVAVGQFGSAPKPGYLTDAAGLALYVGPAECSGACADAWLPAAAPADAAASGDVAPVARPDGTRQWAYRGRPLFRAKADTAPGDTKGAGPGWQLAIVGPALEEGQHPAALGLVRNPKAGGEVLVDHRGMTLYVAARVAPGVADAAVAAKAGPSWQPALAGALTKAQGDWSLVARADGTRQWAYKGRPLYSFAGDLKPGDANGAASDPDWQPATLRRDYLPAGIRLVRQAGKTLLVTADGRTLYARDRYRYSGGNFNNEDGPPPTPATGRALGTEACSAECLAEWRPLAAPADAVPTGYWSVAVRADGSRQWAYQGYPLYTNAADARPGDAVGRDRFDLVDNAAALYWRVATP